MNITRRGFFGGLAALAGAVVIERTFPFRVYSFPEQIRSLNTPYSLFKIGDKFTVSTGVIYEVTGISEPSIGHSEFSHHHLYNSSSGYTLDHSRRHFSEFAGLLSQGEVRAPQTVMDEREFRSIITPTEIEYRKYAGPQRMSQVFHVERPQGDGYYGKRVFNLQRGDKVTKLYTRSYLPGEILKSGDTIKL